VHQVGHLGRPRGREHGAGAPNPDLPEIVGVAGRLEASCEVHDRVRPGDDGTQRLFGVRGGEVGSDPGRRVVGRALGGRRWHTLTMSWSPSASCRSSAVPMFPLAPVTTMRTRPPPVGSIDRCPRWREANPLGASTRQGGVHDVGTRAKRMHDDVTIAVPARLAPAAALRLLWLPLRAGAAAWHRKPALGVHGIQRRQRSGHCDLRPTLAPVTARTFARWGLGFDSPRLHHADQRKQVSKDLQRLVHGTARDAKCVQCRP
jgi:hypothetical protein